MQLKNILQKIFTFDEYMWLFLVLFGIIYLMGITNFLYLLGTFKGFVQFIALILGVMLAILVFLHVFQALCRLVGVNKLYYNLRENRANKKKY